MDMMSFILGLESGEGNVVLESDHYDFIDENDDGNIVIVEREDGE